MSENINKGNSNCSQHGGCLTSATLLILMKEMVLITAHNLNVANLQTFEIGLDWRLQIHSGFTLDTEVPRTSGGTFVSVPMLTDCLSHQTRRAVNDIAIVSTPALFCQPARKSKKKLRNPDNFQNKKLRSMPPLHFCVHLYIYFQTEHTHMNERLLGNRMGNETNNKN